MIAQSCPDWFIPVPGNELFNQSDFCVMKYEAKNVGGVATSQPAGIPWGNISQTDAMTQSASACDGCTLITEAQWLTLAHDIINVPSNWTGGNVGVGSLYRGNTSAVGIGALAASSDDDNGYYGTGSSHPSEYKRTYELSNGEVVWDIAGNIWNWTSGQVASGKPGPNSLAFRQYNASGVAGTGNISPNIFPSHGTPAAASWGSSQAIGALRSNGSDNTLRGFARGTRYGDAAISGPFSLAVSLAPSDTESYVGFRATVE